MKHLFSLLAVLFTLNLSAQTNYKPVEDIIRKYSQYWSTPQKINEINSRGTITHTLDSIVEKDVSSFVINKSEIEYDDEGKTTVIRSYGLDSVATTLRLEAIITFEYLSSGEVSHLVFDTINEETHEIAPFIGMDFFYDASNRLDSTVISTEDIFAGGFGPFISQKQVYSGDLIVQTRQWIFFAILGGWIQSSVTDSEYDANDNIIQQLTSILDLGTGQTAPSDLTVYTYNNEGLKDTVTNYFWGDTSFISNTQSTFDYHDNGTLFNTIEHVYSNDAWENSIWVTYPLEEVTEEYPYTNYEWDPIASTWIPIDSTINFLNPALPFANVAYPSQLGLLSGASNDIEVSLPDLEGSSIDEIQYFFANPASHEFEFQYRDIYYYNLIEGSAVNPVLPEYLSVTPNPSQDQFFIELDNVSKANYTVHTTTGVTIAKGSLIQGKNIIQTSAWLPGVYYITMKLEDGTMYVHKQSVQ